MSGNVALKGTSDGLTITIGSGGWGPIVKQIEEMLNERVAFFKGGRVSISVGERLLDTEQLQALGALLAEQQMTLWSVQCEAPETRAVVRSLGLEVPTTDGPISTPAESEPMTTLTIRRTLRSGQNVEHAGNVVIIGDVNPGARVAAGGHIIVWGKLRGTAHAGAVSDVDAFVCALDLSPMQLIIGQVISRAPAGEYPEQIMPEIAYVQNGQIIAEAWR
jgi:septum site-determining protein MinC